MKTMRFTAPGRCSLGILTIFTFLSGPAAGALIEAPTIIEQPKSQVVMFGQTAVLGVAAIGTEPLSYQWRRSETNLVGAKDATLSIPGATPENSGTYSVVVSNSKGSATGAPAILTVLPALPGAVDTSFSQNGGPNGIVRKVVLTTEGQILIGGAFSLVNGMARRGIARLNGDGSLDASFNPGTGVQGEVYCLAVQNDGKIILGGSFYMVNGTIRYNLARLNSDGSLDLSFDPQAGPDQPVWNLALQRDPNSGEQLTIIAGDFVLYNGTQARHLARLRSNGTLDTTFARGVDGQVRGLAIDNQGRLLVGGLVIPTNGPAKGMLMRLDENGGFDLTFPTNQLLSSWVLAIVVQPDNRILIGGDFRMAGSVPLPCIARLSDQGTLDAGFNPGSGANQIITSLAMQSDGRILAGGGFTMFAGLPRNRLVRLYPDGQVDRAFEPNPGPEWIESVAVQSDGSILVGGSASNSGDSGGGSLARLFGADPLPFAPVIAQSPTSQTVSEGADPTFTVSVFSFPAPVCQWWYQGARILNATQTSLTLFNVRTGSAGNYWVVASNYLGSVTSAPAALVVNPVPVHPGAPDLSFYAGSGADKTVNCLAVQSDNRALVGGTFTAINGVPRNRLARLNTDGSVDTSFVATLSDYTNCWINAIAWQSNGTALVAGGWMDLYGATRYLVLRLQANGVVDGTFRLTNDLSSSAYAVAPLADGSVLVGGNAGLSRLRANGALDTNFNVNLGYSGNVYAIAVQPDGKVLIGGDFTEVQGPRKNLARVNSDGSLDPTFNPGSGANSLVHAIALQPDGKVLVAGNFTKVNGRPRSRIARLEPDGTLDASFDAGSGPSHNVYALTLLPNGKILIGGTFGNVNGAGPSGIARLNRDGTVDTVFDAGAGANDTVRAIGVQTDGHVLICGQFTEVSGIPRQGIARLWGGDVPPHRPAIVVQPESQFVRAGDDVTFTVDANGQPTPAYQWQHDTAPLSGAENWILTLRNVRITNAGAYAVTVGNPLGALLSSFAVLTVLPPVLETGAPDIDFYCGFGPNEQVNAVAVLPDQAILLAGDFTVVDGVNRNHLARLLPNGRLDLSFDPGLGPDGRVMAVAVQLDNKILIGGYFSSFNRMARSCVARLNVDGSLDSTFEPRLGLYYGNVNALALQPDGRILLGGSFETTNTPPRQNLCRLNHDGSLDPTFTHNLMLSGNLSALVLQPDGRMLVGGYLGPYLGMGVVRLWNNGSQDTTFTFNLGWINGSVNTIALQPDGKVLIGGDFSYINGVSRNLLARLNANGAVDLSFDSQLMNQGKEVQSIAVQGDGKVLIGGTFTYINQMLLNRIARLNNNGSLDLTFDPGLGVTEGNTYFDDYGELADLTAVHSIALENDGKVVLGGDFGRVNGLPRYNLARLFNRDPSARIELRDLSTLAGPRLEMRWEAGVLLQADHLEGPWHDVPGAISPYLINSAGPQRFYRLRFN